MRLLTLGVRNVTRSRFRTTMTVLGVAVAIVAFVMLRTILSAWTSASDYAAKDRVVTRHKVSFIMSLPGKYLTEVRQIDGVQHAAAANWFGGKDPNRPNEFFATIAVDPEDYLQVYDELVVPEDQRRAWFESRTGALVGDSIAKKMGWHVGDKVTLQGTIFSGDWTFEISGIYTASRKSVDRTTFFFHYDYLNEWVRENFPTEVDNVGWIVTRIDKSENAAQMAKRIDQHFDERDVQTMSQDERAFATSFLGMISAILKALDVVSVVIMAIMMLILGNTIAMGVRERTHEYGVLRAIGFRPKHLITFVLGEAATIGLLGGLLGLALAYPLVERGLGRFLEENMGNFFPYFRIPPETWVVALVLSTFLGLLAAVLPAYQAAKLDVVDSLRNVG
jgi:putative ABC transport system permease protein